MASVNSHGSADMQGRARTMRSGRVPLALGSYRCRPPGKASGPVSGEGRPGRARILTVGHDVVQSLTGPMLAGWDTAREGARAGASCSAALCGGAGWRSTGRAGGEVKARAGGRGPTATQTAVLGPVCGTRQAQNARPKATSRQFQRVMSWPVPEMWSGALRPLQWQAARMRRARAKASKHNPRGVDGGGTGSGIVQEGRRRMCGGRGGWARGMWRVGRAR